MNQGTIQIFFALLRSAIRGTNLTEKEQNEYSPEQLSELLNLAAKHDLIHLLAYGLKQNQLVSKENFDIEKHILKAVYRYEQLRYNYETLCKELEKAQIPFLPLKGSVIRKYYPEAWMRTSCDIDILLHREHLDAAISYMTSNLGYVRTGHSTHDVSLFSSTGVHVELHFDLVEEGRANHAIGVLGSVWDNVSVREGSAYWYEMTDAFFYFYHVAHMAKHFENGGCGIRPFIDLWILDHLEGVDLAARDRLLADGGLLAFANTSRALSKYWCGETAKPDDLSMRLEAFILHGGVYGSYDNRIALQQKKKGGRIGYFFSRIFIPYVKLKQYYPILEKHRWLTPIMQVRRWFMVFKPDVAKKAKIELEINKNMDADRADAMNRLLNDIGLN